MSAGGDKNKRPIIVKRAAKKHHGHHGGAWKVAFADFMTAMMAFFMVLWIMGMDSDAKEMIEGYFSNPVGFKKAYGAGSNPLSSGNAPQNMDVKRIALMAREAQRMRFMEAAEQLEERLQEVPELGVLRDQVEIVVTSDGLRIELIDGNTNDMFFQLSSARMLPPARAAIEVIGQELAKLPNPIVIEGHTDAAQYGSEQYSNWELSVDRANSARRGLLGAGVAAPRFSEVRGYADRQLRIKDNPFADANRRISILLPFTEVEPATAKLPVPLPSGPPLPVAPGH
jgi:chemotaxis protein MotB